MNTNSFYNVKNFTLFTLVVLFNCYRVKADFVFGEPVNLGPVVNSSSLDGTPNISTDGLEMYFTSTRPGGHGDYDLWMVSRSSISEDWSNPTNLGASINSSIKECFPCLSPDGFTMYFSDYYMNPVRSGGYGGPDLWMCTRIGLNDPWRTPVNLGTSVNTGSADVTPTMSGDGLTMVFVSNRSGGSGRADIWMATRTTTQNEWGAATNLKSGINTSYFDGEPAISADGLVLFFTSDRGGGLGGWDLWMSTRKTQDDSWSQSVNLGPMVNTSSDESTPFVSPDMKNLYFGSNRSGGSGNLDIWSIPIQPIIDLNGDGIVDASDMCILVDHWGTNNPLCDIGPAPWGDGIVDVQDMIVLAEHLFEEVTDSTLIAHWALNETEGMFAADSAGNNDAVVLGGIEWQPTGGQIDGALKLDGVSGYAIAGEVLNPAEGPFSVIAWIKGGAPGQVVLSQTGAANWLCMDSVEGCLMTELRKDSGRFEGDPLLSEVIIKDGNWHRIGFVWDGSCRYLYVDGMEVTNDSEPLSGLNDAFGGLYIGTGSNCADGTFFSGLIDDVRIYDRVVCP
ncbi:LamG-like jellyroll fold domain-containing protein [Planctomycetota bacterium]